MKRATSPLPAVFGLLIAFAVHPVVHADPPFEVSEWEVADGTAGVLVEDHRVPLVAVRIEFPAGTWMSWFREHRAEEAFEIQIHDRKGSLRKRSDDLAAGLILDVDTRTSTLRFSCRKADLEEVLSLASDVLANRDFDRAELSRWKTGRTLEWKRSLKEPRFILLESGARLLFREGDPRRAPYEKPTPLLRDTKRLAATRDALIRLPGRVIGFAGDLTREEARRFAERLLPEVLTEVPEGLDPRLGPIVPRAERPDAMTPELSRLTQTYYAYGRDSMSLRDPDYAASMIADHVLGGHFNSRLMTALRHEGGETYGAGVYDDGGYEAGQYALTTFTRTDNAAATETKLRAVLEEFHAGGVTEDERAAAAGNVVGSRAFARQSPSQVLSERLWERRLGLPAGFRDDLAERAARLPLDEINAFIRRFYDPREFTMLKLVAAD